MLLRATDSGPSLEGFQPARVVLKNGCHAGASSCWVPQATDPVRECAMPNVIAVGARSPVRWMLRLAEPLIARWGWLTGKVPVGVTPTLTTSRRWR
jgi:hypothetical protein